MRKFADSRFLMQHGAAAGFPRPHSPGGQRRRTVSNRLFRDSPGIDLEFDGTFDSLDRIAEKKTSPLQRAKQIRYHRKTAADNVFKQQCRTLVGIDPSLNLCHLQLRVDGVANPDQILVPIQILNALPGATITHAASIYD